MSYCFKITILAEICIKKRYFYWKKCKKCPALGTPLPDPLASDGYVGWGLYPQTLNNFQRLVVQPPNPYQLPLRISAYATGLAYLPLSY